MASLNSFSEALPKSIDQVHDALSAVLRTMKWGHITESGPRRRSEAQNSAPKAGAHGSASGGPVGCRPWNERWLGGRFFQACAAAVVRCGGRT